MISILTVPSGVYLWWFSLLTVQVLIMSEGEQGGQDACQAQETINWKLCFLCQSDDAKKGALVQSPRLNSYGHVLEIVRQRASLSDGDYVKVQRRLQNCTAERLATQKAVWHRSCHSGATNKDQIQRAKNRFAHVMSTGQYTAKKRGQKRGSTEMADSGPSDSEFPPPFSTGH